MGKTIRKCVAPNCESRMVRGMPVTKRLFGLPAGREGAEWLKFLKADEEVIGKQIFLCEDHFEDKYFTSTLKVRLSKFARPTIHTNFETEGVNGSDQTPTNNEDSDHSSKEPPLAGESRLSPLCLPKPCSRIEYSEEATDLLKKCRLCLLNSGKYTISLEADLAQKISDYIQIKLIETPDYPQSICVCCKHLLDTLHSFVSKARSANAKLESFLKDAVSIVEPDQTGTLEKCVEEMEEPSQMLITQNNDLKADSFSGSGDTETIGNRKFKCEFCGEKFLLSIQYRKHKRTHSVLYLCNQIGCRRTFLTEKRFKMHLHHHARQKKRYTLALRQRKYTCQICKKYFINLKLLVQHRETHVNFKCPFFGCSTILKTWKTFKTHMSLHEDRRCLCQVCGKTFRTYNHLYNHERIHKGVRYKCEVCDVTYATKSSLTDHMRVKHKGVRFYCSMCPNSYATNLSLKYHEKMHGGKKDYQCNLCDKSFYFKKNLNVHIQRHQGIKRYQCKFCFKSFILNSTLRCHEKIHYSEKFYCTVEGCERILSRIDRLRNHIKVAHPEQVNVLKV